MSESKIQPELKATFKIEGFFVDKITHYKHDGEDWVYSFRITNPEGAFTYWRHMASNLKELKATILDDIRHNEIEFND